MAILQTNVDYAFSICRPRHNKAYGYGGVWVRNDVNRTTDCSGIVTHVLDACVNGERMTWSRHGLSTEAYRYVGGPGSRGPFGTIRVARPGDIPSTAVVRIGLQHGPGGGANSHMACTVNGVNIESSGSFGQQIGGRARGYDHSMFNDWFYLPGPIGGGSATPNPPQAPGAVYLGRDCSRYECKGARVLALQTRLNRDFELYSALTLDGEFGPNTEAVVREFQMRSNLTIDGVAGPAVLAAIGLSFQAQETPPVTPRTDRQLLEKIADDVAEIRLQLSAEGHDKWTNRGTSVRDQVYAIAKKLGV